MGIICPSSESGLGRQKAQVLKMKFLFSTWTMIGPYASESSADRGLQLFLFSLLSLSS